MFGLEGRKRNAVAYYRHSAEDKQENSVGIQQSHAEDFAAKHDLTIIHHESDEGKSGLSASRPGFERLFDLWITNEDAPSFDYILVLDETRWGRWQDTDEAAYWTMICKKHGKQVVYISRGFPKEEQKLLSSLETSIGRYMAAEYSRQLSDKVWHGSIKVSEQGFSAGGIAPYGYVRVLLDERHNRIGILNPGEHKMISNQRVSFEPASDHTPEVVRRVFDQFVNYWSSPTDIAQSLNEDGILSAKGKPWNGSKILRILTNETYIGTRVYNKTWGRLKQKHRKNPVSEWVRAANAFDAIVDADIFAKAQERLYWISPHRWKRGVYRVSQTERLIRKHVDGLISAYDPDERFNILRKLPLTFGLTYYSSDSSKRCFQITEDMRKYNEVIGVSVNMFAKQKIDAVFALPTKQFGVGNYLVLDDHDTLTDQFRLDSQSADEKVLNMSEALRSS